MKITYHKTEAQQNRAWYTPERKPIRGSIYKRNRKGYNPFK